MIKLFSPAKLNLSLTLCDRRQDGYYILDSLVCFIDLQDQITLSKSSHTTLACYGQFAKNLCNLPIKDNLIIKALNLLRDEDQRIKHYKITLKKNIPIGAGLGGGSANAAAIIRHFTAKWPKEKQLRLAITLGADVPVCLYSSPLRVRGIGDKVYPLEYMTPQPIMIITPQQILSTAKVFQQIDSSVIRTRTPAVTLHKYKDWHNDLLTSAQILCPEINFIINQVKQLTSAYYTGLTGSGSSIFALFKNQEECNSAVRVIHKIKNQKWFLYNGFTL